MSSTNPRAACDPGVSILTPELLAALAAQGENGERAAKLLQAAEAVLADGVLPAAGEVAQSCCRGALDSILKIAGEDFPGPQRATREVVVAARTVTAAWDNGNRDAEEELGALTGAVATLDREEADPGGFRIKQVGYLIREQTGWEMGSAERVAALKSWSRFYRETSGVLHGTTQGADAAAVLKGVVAAIGRLFLDLPERAHEVRRFALLSAPTPADATDEVALWTDPRAGAYFFRAAVSEDWLRLLPVERLMPEETRWPARPYLQRLLTADPRLVCTWAEGNVDSLRVRGPHALTMAATLLGEAGMDARKFMRKAISAADGNTHVLTSIGLWAQQVPVSKRDRSYVGVIEGLLRDQEFADGEMWESTRLLLALLETAYPGGHPRSDDGKLATGVRYALATTMAKHAEDPASSWTADRIDLQKAAVDDAHQNAFLFPLMRAALDLARTDAQHGLDLRVRTSPLMKHLPSGTGQRLKAVHLLECHSLDCAAPGPKQEAWWSAALESAEIVVRLRSPGADVADFLHLVVQECPTDQQKALGEALHRGLGTPPDQSEIDTWQQAYADQHSNPPLSHRWYAVWLLSPVLPAAVLEPWQPLLRALQEIAGPPAARPTPMTIQVTRVPEYGGLALAPFADQASAEGPAAAAAALMLSEIPRDDVDDDAAREALLADLVAGDPETWATDPVGIVGVAITNRLRCAYFRELNTAQQGGKIQSPSLLETVATAAFTVRPADEDSSEIAQSLRRVICQLLQRAFDHDLGQDAGTGDAVAWLSRLVTSWRDGAPRGHLGDPLAAALSSCGGAALNTLTAWGLRQARAGSGELPPMVADTLASVLEDLNPDEQALAIIGCWLTGLARHAPSWSMAHAGHLYNLAPPAGPARTWLAYGAPDSSIVAGLDRDLLIAELCAPRAATATGRRRQDVSREREEKLLADRVSQQQADGTLERVVCALLDAGEPLGPVGDFLRQVANYNESGPDVVSRMLASVAWHTAQAPGEPIERAVAVWQAALGARLPATALAGAGQFAFSSVLDDERWLELTDRTILQQPRLDTGYKIAQRAVRHPSSPAAPRIVAGLLGASSTGRYEHLQIEQFGSQLLDATSPSPDREALQTALIKAGRAEAAFVDEPADPA